MGMGCEYHACRVTDLVNGGRIAEITDLNESRTVTVKCDVCQQSASGPLHTNGSKCPVCGESFHIDTIATANDLERKSLGLDPQTTIYRIGVRHRGQSFHYFAT